jgi:hypothetical protein
LTLGPAVGVAFIPVNGSTLGIVSIAVLTVGISFVLCSLLLNAPFYATDEHKALDQSLGPPIFAIGFLFFGVITAHVTLTRLYSSPLVGLLLPAVQSAREAGRKSACSNNVKQVALGAANYESAKRKYPTSGEGKDNYGGTGSAAGTPNYATFVSSDVEGNGSYVGGLVGSYGSGYVTNVEMTGSVTGWRTAGVPDYTNGGYTGGIGGYVSSTDVKYVRFTGSLVKGSHQTGGLIGHHDNTINNSYSTGEITSNSDYVGGLAGYGVHFNDSYATGNVSSPSNFVGGLAGQAAGTINRSYTTGNVTGLISGSTINYAATYVGGLAGYTNGWINDSYYTGALVKGGHQTGGLVGHIDGRIYRSYATGVVLSNSSYVGGLVGYMGDFVFNSYATGNVTGSGDHVGGLAGYAGYIGTSYATGNVRGHSSYVGGLAGRFGWIWSGGTSYATGNVEGNGERVGGLAGTSDGGDIFSAYATGNVIGYNHHVGGLVGYLGGGTVTNA